MKKIYVALLIIIMCSQCKTLHPIDCKFPDTECVLVGITTRIVILNKDSTPVALDRWYTKNLRTGSKLKQQHAAKEVGSYLVLDGNRNTDFAKSISCNKDSIQFVGIKNGKIVVREGYNFKQEPCGLQEMDKIKNRTVIVN